MYHFCIRINGIITLHLTVARWVLIAGVLLWLVVAASGCAATSSRAQQEIIITDSTTRRTYQRLVAVSVPGDSAQLHTRLVYDEATRQFRPVTLFSSNGRSGLSLTLDALGNLSARSVTVPFVAQVPVTDSETTRIRTEKRERETAAKAPLSRFVKFCIGFTILAILLLMVVAYLKFFTPLRFL